MASVMIGRTVCPDCGFNAAHVKRTDKCDYRYCPECNITTHMKTERQKADLAAKTRPLEVRGPSPTPEPEKKSVPSDPTPTPTPPSPSPAPEAVAVPAPAKRRGLFA